MATSIFDLARQFGGVVENTKPQPEEDSLLSLARQFGGEVVETAPAGVEVEEPVNPEEQRRLGPAGPVGFGVLDLLVAPFAREKDPRLTGVARGAELLGSGLEATARVADILPEAAPPTTPVISTIKSAAPQLQEWANNLSNWGKQFDSEYATDLGSLTENPANAVPFIIERFIGSLPDMAAATYALPAYIPALANDILNQRLENDGKTIEQATIGDVAAATAAAAIQGPLERFATRRLGEPGGVLGQTAFQAGTEAAQEVTQYAAETAGTQVGFDPEQAGLIGLEAGIVGGGIGAAAGAVNTVEQNAIRRNIEERFRRGEDVRSEEEMIELDRLREKAFEDAKGIVAPELPVDAEPLQFGTAYSERIYDSIGQYIPANEEFKVEEKVVDGIARFVVTDRNGTQYGQALGNKSQADALSNSLNNTTQERAKVLEQLYPLQRSLSEVMKGYGLNDVALSIDKRIFTRRGKALTSEGLFDPVVRQVFLAVDAVDPDGTLDPSQRREALRGVLRHEVVHALRYLDLWKKSEWKNLEKTVSTLKKPGTEETYLQIASKNYGDQSKVIQVEEAVAELIRDVAGNLSKVAGKPRSLSERAINFFDRAKNALTGSGFQTYEDIVRRVEEGIVGSRQRGRIRTLRATEEQMGYQGITPERIQPLFNNPEERNRFREETAQKMQAQVPAPSQPALNNLRLNAVRESRSTIDPVPPKIRVDEQEVPTRDSEGRLIYSGYEGPEVFGIQTRPTQEGLQNFWRWFGSSKVKDKQGRPQLFYHGTAADITEFRPKQAGSVFVTRSPQFAEEFSFYSDNYMVSNFPDFMSDQQVLDALDETLASPNAFAPKLYDEMYDARRQAALDVQNGKSIRPYALKKFKSIAAEGRSSRYLNAIQKRLPSSANLMPVYVKADKPWDYDSKNDVSSVVKRARDNGADITPSMIEEISQGNWQTIEGSEGNAPILDAIRELGYDSMYVEEQGEKNLAVFDPNQIKSAVGNTGDFSPITPSIRESRKEPTYNIVNSRTGEVVGQANTIGGARRAVDRRDNQYGAYVHTIQTVDSERDIAARNVARERLGLPPIERESRVRNPQLDTPEFQRFIKDSKVVDESGQPLVVYHGTKRDIDVFRTFTQLRRKQIYAGDIGTWFASTPRATDYFSGVIRGTNEFGMDGAVYPAYLSIKNPKEYGSYSEFLDDIRQYKSAKSFRSAVEKQGFDGLVVRDSDTDAGGLRDDWVAFAPNQIKSAVGNIGTFDITRPSIRESRRSPNVVSLMSNEEQPPRKLRGKTQVAQYLQDRALEALGGRVRDLNNETDRDSIAEDLVAEALYEMEVQKNALEWYDSTIERTIEMMAIKHPEIKTDPNARTAFLVGLAITSQNLAVPDNLKYSEEVYNHFKKNGRFPEKGFGSKSPSIKRNFEKANMLIEELGSMEAFTDFLQTEFTVGQLNPILKSHLGKGAKVGGELVGAKVYGSSVFGPKIGNGFYTNLRGDFSPVTIDMWFMRTIGRLRGKVMEFDEKKFGKQLARLAKAEGMEGASTDDLVARAQQLAKQHEKDYKLFKDEYKAKIRNKSESTNAAITIVKSLKATRDAPSTGREREQLRDIVNRAINKMRDRTGQDISPAAFQALIWYPEQDLYKKLGVKLKHVRQDYANSTKQFLRREGIDERELKRAEDRVRSRRQRRAEPVRPGAVAPVEAAVTPAGERVSEPVQVAEAVVPRARESRVTGPASVTEPGPDTDIDTTGAAEALNEGQPVNSLGIPVGPLLTYTMPDGTVAPRARESRTGDPIRGAKIDPVMKRLIRSVEFFESAPDKLRGGVGLGDIASRIENYYDTWDARLGEVNNIIRNVTNSMSRSELRSAQDTFERYMTARENNRAQDAADIFRNATPNDRQLISAWESITNITGRVNRDVRGPDGEPIKVWDSKQEKWRPIGTIRDFFPRTLRREVMEVMMNPDLDPLLYDQLLDAVVTSGKAQTRDEAEDFLLRDYFSDEVKSDYFAGVEKARTEALPEIFYDYSWNAATRYLNKWARRTSQIEYFGQELGPFKKDWFDTNIPKIRNRETQDYLNQIKDRIYEVETFGFWNNAMKWGNQLATGLQLGNPASAFLNVVGGDVANIQMYGWREVAKAHASLLLDWRRVQEEGTKLGILNKDYLRITQDGIERDAGKYFATEDKVSVALSKFTDVILTFSGFNGAENIVRATAMLAARGFLDSSLRAINRNPNSNKSKKFIEYVNRENLDLDKLILENGAGPETDKFMRRGVNVPQGSYRIDMTPVFVDTNVGRFFFKYQKFGTQINRFFYRNFFKPWWDDKTDALKFLRLLAFLFPAIFGGEIINQFRRFLGYSGDYGPTYAQISKAFEKDETALGWGLIISRAMQNVTVAGSFGFFGNYYQFGKDVMDQQRVKNPMSPPALSSVDALIDLGYRIYDQGQLTARDFDEIAENTMSFYRANKRLVLASMSELGSEAKEVKRFVAQRDIREIRRYGLRYAQEMEIEGKRQRTSSGPPVRTEMTPTNKAIVDALYQGDSATARTLIKQALKGKNFKEKQKTNQSIRASIRSRQPIQIGGSSPNNQERVAFLKWAKKNLSAEEYQKIVTMDRRYRRAAARVNMGFGDD